MPCQRDLQNTVTPTLSSRLQRPFISLVAPWRSMLTRLLIAVTIRPRESAGWAKIVAMMRTLGIICESIRLDLMSTRLVKQTHHLRVSIVRPKARSRRLRESGYRNRVGVPYVCDLYQASARYTHTRINMDSPSWLVSTLHRQLCSRRACQASSRWTLRWRPSFAGLLRSVAYGSCLE